jgi:UDP-N-acetylglucosamine 3-dehydrogenase
MGRRHVRVFRGLCNRFDVVGGYDPRSDDDSLDGLERLETEDEAIARGELVIVATPFVCHADTVVRALHAGKHVFVEKPLCATLSEARKVVMAARGRGRLFVGHSERFNPVVRSLVGLIRADGVVSMDLKRESLGRPGDGGALINLGVHDLDLAAYLGGGEIVFRGAAGPVSAAEEDFAHVLFSTACGAPGHLFVSRTSPTPCRKLVLTTHRWVYEGDLASHRLVRVARAARGTSAWTEVAVVAEEALVAQAMALADDLDGCPSRELANGLDGARAVAVAERARAEFDGRHALRSLGRDPFQRRA